MSQRSRTAKADQRPSATPPSANPFVTDDGEEYVDERVRLPEEERRERARRARMRDLRESHWHMRVCAQGHVIETHRSTDDNAREMRCPICGSLARMESPDETAQREDNVFHDPLAALSRAFDAMQDWGQRHLDASSWTRKAEALREGIKTRGDVFDHWRPKSQR